MHYLRWLSLTFFFSRFNFIYSSLKLFTHVNAQIIYFYCCYIQKYSEYNYTYWHHYYILHQGVDVQVGDLTGEYARRYCGGSIREPVKIAPHGSLHLLPVGSIPQYPDVGGEVFQDDWMLVPEEHYWVVVVHSIWKVTSLAPGVAHQVVDVDRWY